MGKAAEAELIVGAGTHRDTHTAVLCDARGRTLSQLQVAATSAGYARLLQWADTAAAGRPVAWAIEGTRHYGLGLARYLAASGRQAAKIGAARHVGRRRAGKSDPIDAVRAARHRLNRLDDRQLNRALHTIAVSRMRPRGNPGLRPAPSRRRQNRPRDPPLHQALPRPPPLPHPQPP